MNCHGEQFIEYFNKIPEIYNNYNINIIETYNNLHDETIIQPLKNADYLILNNVKQYEIFKPANLKLYVKESCICIVIEFIRFDGFFPLEYIVSPFNKLRIYDDSFKNTSSYEEYINYKIADNIINDHFNKSLKKLKLLDEQSDIKFYDFFIKNYKTELLFRDDTHLTHVFMKYLLINLLKAMNINVDINTINELNINYTYGFKFRYRPILKCVKELLNLTFNDDIINFYNMDIQKSDFYKIINTYHNSQYSEIEIKCLEYCIK